MRVLHLLKSYFPYLQGGIEQMVAHLCHEMKSQDVTTTLFALHPSQHTAKIPAPSSWNNASILWGQETLTLAGTPCSFHPKTWKALYDAISNTDVIHCHMPWPFGDLIYQLLGRNKPLILTYHSDIVRQKYLSYLYAPLQKAMLRKATIVATSPAYVESSKTLTPYRARTKIIPLGLSQDLYPQPSPATFATWQDRFPSSFVLFVGVLRYYKGLHTLLQACQGLPFPIVIAGTGPQETQLKQQAACLGLDNVHFLGSISEEDKTALLQLCSFFVFPSHQRSEAFGLSLVEASMHSKAMISCQINTGTSYVNLQEETGYVIPPENPLSLRQALKDLWETPEKTQKMGQRARQRYEQLFTAKTMAQAYATLYHEARSAPSFF